MYPTVFVGGGVVISPDLFNIYIDVIGNKLNEVKNVGCVSGTVVVYNLVYADDMCLIAPSGKGLQKLIDKCVKEARQLDIKYNINKTMCMCVQPKSWKLAKMPC